MQSGKYWTKFRVISILKLYQIYLYLRYVQTNTPVLFRSIQTSNNRNRTPNVSTVEFVSMEKTLYNNYSETRNLIGQYPCRMRQSCTENLKVDIA